ncbi:bifunctional proline dehydrogenase/L-glutamate gamma-semialdehyde dehydrogenase PutA [Labrys monachus]|uniref:Bifunctional protein PutA n=1 Tax=Labrys monachus TaxID=217067 RepID=A0ABU0F809_9HYPH|nr:bifunctional proline dehydrogenase/L-glutamate gamma-semialdehyde dehydrogenase PutA [Labrys monachus]MDQ0390746.1 RHH-type proline utilization regulon transcriptional repressor/proline dehydrogenase/delta 1-pyrroline-5-carboxylate dehydrogenase [Labrys monachus]
MSALPSFHAPYAEDDGAIVSRLLADPVIDQAGEARIDAAATRLIEAIRASAGSIGGIEDFLREYSLSTKEGLALMILAEALLRVPDKETADALIEDKLGQGDWRHRETRSDAFLVSASAWALGMTARVIHPGETPEGIVASLAKRIGLPAVRTATRQAMKVLGSHFVLGQTIGEALKRSASGGARGFRYSFDMLGEGARTAEDARRYFKSYADAIDAIGRAAGNEPLPARPGISVKLSALHPRYEALSRERVMAELVPLVRDLARKARGYELNFTVDAEEADRLELSLEVIAAVLADPALEGWTGFGLAIQAYQKRAFAVIEHVEALAKALGRQLMVRLVKGAYWDTEVKRAQERGLDDYPVFTRKPVTDLNYIRCARRMLAARPHLYPQFATHNALSIATIIEIAGGVDGYEFQRLHGMGDLAYKALMKERPGTACRVYAPVGGHADLLAYLVRRLLENGANSNFVSVAADPAVPVSDLLRRPAAQIGSAARARHARIPLPKALYGAERANSAGVELGSREAVAALQADLAAGARPVAATPLIGGRPAAGQARPVCAPADGTTVVGTVAEADEDGARAAMQAAAEGFRAWDRSDVARRAGALEKAADLLEQRRGLLLALLQAEAGKTIDDAVAELREAVDFCRYYAAQARRIFGAGEVMPGPTGEENRLLHRGRGVFVCISPWNFPLAIFLGQVAAALAAGNSVVAKPAEQTPLIAYEAVKILIEAGVPGSALQYVPGDGRIGAGLVAHPAVAGVAFTGSTETAWAINRALAARNGAIVPLIAETGGINAMIVDATALPEQVADDVVVSAFRSAGQRCSALRLLCVQDDVADKIVTMIKGAAQELKLGDPRDLSVQIGPVIDAEAKAGLEAHIAAMAGTAKIHLATPALDQGSFVGPHILEIGKVGDLTREVFGPVLHVVRWKAGGLDALLDAIAASGYGLTLGVHSRIDTTIETVAERMPAGNVYVNRNMIGAVVGTQPFGGTGLSGTGPKAGGPNYLKRFATEQVVAVNTAAAGGNASLIAMGED